MKKIKCGNCNKKITKRNKDKLGRVWSISSQCNLCRKCWELF